MTKGKNPTVTEFSLLKVVDQGQEILRIAKDGAVLPGKGLNLCEAITKALEVVEREATITERERVCGLLNEGTIKGGTDRDGSWSAISRKALTQVAAPKEAQPPKSTCCGHGPHKD